MRQSGLGKGLGALLPSGGDLERSSAEGQQGAARLLELPIGSIRPNTYQPRTVFDDESISALSESIKEIGVLQPILVRSAGNGSYELIAGERRWRAARRAGLEVIPAVIRTADNHDALEQALVENLHREDLNPLEEAAAYQQLVDEFGLTHEQVSTRVGKSRVAITNALRLFQLSPGIQRMIHDGQIHAGHARALLGTTDKAFQEALARRIVAEGLSVRAVEEAVRLRTGGQAPSGAKTSKPKAERPAGLLELEEVFADYLETRVAVEMAPNRKGKITIEFADLNDLERIFRVVTRPTGAEVRE